MTIQQIYSEAKKAFINYQNNRNAYVLKNRLLQLADEMVGIETSDDPDVSNILTKEQVEIFKKGFIIPQITDAVRNPKEFGYLLSVESSGSLLTQFEPYVE